MKRYIPHILNLSEKIKKDNQADIKMACAKAGDDWSWILWLGSRAKVEVPTQFELSCW